MSKEKLKIGYSRLTEAWYYTGGRTKIDITEEIEAVLEDKNKQIADLEAKLAESKETINNLEQQCLICNKDKENEELNQQLAESETEIKSLSSEISSLEQDLTHYKGEAYNLKDQLAEKEKEIEKLTEELDDKNFCKDFVDLYSENKLKTQMLHENWKDKISFAVEQLEKVKEFCKENRTPDNNDVLTINVDDELKIDDNLLKFIDNQIEELKKGGR